MSSRLKAGLRRESILLAGADVFAAEGFEGATTAVLAEAAGISEPILYRHFSGKEDLFCTVLQWAAEEILADWDRIAAGISSVRERILALTTLHPHVLANQGAAYRVLQVAQASIGNPQVRTTLARCYSKLEKRLSGLIRQGQDSGELRDDLAPETAAWTLLSLGLAFRLTQELELPIAGGAGWSFGAGSRYLDTMRETSVY